MRVSLRKANALQQSIRDLIQVIEVEGTLRINEFQDASQVIAKAQADVTQNLQRRIALQEALYEIRASVADANYASGIQKLLTEAQRIERVQAEYANVVRETNKMVPLEEIKARQEKFQKQDQDLYGRNEIITGVLDETRLGTFKVTVANLKNQKQDIQDKLLELNVKTEVELAEGLVAVLKSENIL